MARIAQIHVRKQRGHMVVTGMTQTPRGQRVIAKTVVLKAKSARDPELRTEIAAAVAEIMTR